MRNLKIIIISLILVSSIQTFGQKSRQGEIVELKSSINLIPFDNSIQKLSNDSILNCDKPTVIFFWLSTCEPCIKELNSINTNSGFIKLKNQIKIIVVSDDKLENHEKAKSISKKFNWWFDVYFDYGYALRNNLLNNWFGVPQSMIIDKNKTITMHKFGYCQGDEKIILNKIKKLLKNNTCVNNVGFKAQLGSKKEVLSPVYSVPLEQETNEPVASAIVF